MNKYEIVEESQGDKCFLYIKQNGVTEKVLMGKKGDPQLIEKAIRIIDYLKVNPLYERIIYEIGEKKIVHFKRGAEEFMNLYINGKYRESLLIVSDENLSIKNYDDAFYELVQYKEPEEIITKTIYQE